MCRSATNWCCQAPHRASGRQLTGIFEVGRRSSAGRADERAAAKGGRHVREPEVAGRAGRVLVVDDEPNICALLSATLRLTDFDVRIEHGGTTR